MRILRVLIGTAALFGATASAAAASRADWDACKGDDPDRSIAACTRIIQGRGETAKDSAIADLNEAIRLDPKSASAYNNWGSAYAFQDDLDRAIADFSDRSGSSPAACWGCLRFATRSEVARLYQ